jgi:hypothetical protein
MKHLKRFNEDIDLHDPRGREIKVGRFLIHKSMPENREDILKSGLIPRIGDRYQIDGGNKNRLPATFATNSENEKDWFGEDWDEDVWRIDTSLIPNIKWYKDRMFSFKRSGFPFPFLYKHVVTLDSIPPNAIELIYKGSGRLKIK